MIFIVFIIFNNCSWGGLFLLIDSYIFILLVLISLFILRVVLISEKDNVLMILSNLLVFVCCLFFISGSILILYVFFEISIFPILVIILGYGFQIEKINSSYYLIFYAAMCSFPFLFVYFKSDFIISYVFYTQLIS
jgi:NADH-ubiquinone oxidoreductase chain 4